MTLPEQSTSSERRAWWWAGAWLFFIYGSIPLARTVQVFIRDIGAAALFLWITFATLLVAAIAIIRIGIRRRRSFSLVQMALLAVIIGFFGWMTWALRANPEEAFHFVQYGVLSVLVYRAMRFRFSDMSIYLATFAVGALAGIVDELIQWITPRRFFDFRDIGINVISGLLVQLGIAVGIRPVPLRWQVSAAGWRITFATVTVSIALLLLCALNTPELHAAYSRFTPGIIDAAGPTADYGHRISDPVAGVFFSRLLPEQIRAEDAARGDRVGPWLSNYKTDVQYEDFLRRYSSRTEPFAVQARVHIFRRDRYARDLRNQKLSPVEKAEKARVAYHENLILETFFPRTLQYSSYLWPADKRAAMAAQVKGGNYVSAVGAHLITSMSQPQLVLVLFTALLAALAGERWAARRMMHEQSIT